jgi:predicted aspartyl protease
MTPTMPTLPVPVLRHPFTVDGRPPVGRVTINVELSNNSDAAQVRAGTLPPERVRRISVPATVDTGRMRLALPESVVAALGLPPGGEVNVAYADGRTVRRNKAKSVLLQYLGRDGVFDAIVEPARTDALVGAIVLEELDLLVDCANQKLVPRDPNILTAEIE